MVFFSSGFITPTNCDFPSAVMESHASSVVLTSKRIALVCGEAEG